ncbi:MAG: DHH family phosphoesterase [candidate division WOR-3 bacterium]
MKWKFKKPEFPIDKYQLPRAIALILSTRKIPPDEAANFLYPEKMDTFDPFRMSSIGKIVERLAQALEKREKILVHGDYDVDGITATALLFNALDRLGFYVDYYIPHRATEGYGLSTKAIEKASKENYKVIITVDTGISALQAAYIAKFKGIDVIITDHHEPLKKPENTGDLYSTPHLQKLPGRSEEKKNKKNMNPLLPTDAYAILNPKLESDYPDPNLAGVGVAFKLVEALYKYFEPGSRDYEEDLDLVALGTVGDMVPLLKENRILVKKGLNFLRESQKLGIKALKEISGINDGEINPFHISFILAPRINAAGRISHAYDSLKLLLTSSEDEAYKLAEHLQKLNNQRREEEKRIFEEAFSKASKLDLKENYIIVLESEKWNYGVIGIVASKLMQEFRRPVILFSYDPEKHVWRGSGRSIEEFDMHEALSLFENHLEAFGGHKLACGLKVATNKLNLLKEKLNEYASNILKGLELEPVLEIDGTIDIEDLNPDMLSYYEHLKPFGVANKEPVFALEKVLVNKNAIKIYKDRHVSFNIEKGEKAYRCIFFDGVEKLKLIIESERIDIAFSILPKDNGKQLELKVLDVRSANF